ncbi:Uncharacterized WD repeat-containing protein all2124 [Durusdinium trenchii]|uniref:Uncharacterized WD repeat-containing protein all2124 n=1 Tax=Durusdinium trenchii TaxID=1381693 RepID=A0ABP0LLH4_9DINO
MAGSVAVGAYDAPHVAILDTETLMTLAELDVEGVDPRDNLSIFAWSQNGQRLYAGGRARRERSDFFVRVFDTFQNILVKDVVVSTSTIEGLATLGDGRVLFASADPRIGIFDDELALGSSVKSRISDLRLTPRERRQNIAGLELSENGESIRWRPSAFHEKTRLSYSIQRRRVSKAIESAPEDNFYSVLTSTPEISIDKWIDDYRTTMNDKVLEELYDFEQARAVAIAPVSQSSIILGSDFRLRKFDASGALNWEREAPGTVWQLNYTRDEKIVVAAFSDGTIRWYDSDDGDERLALFVSDADIEPLWIAWTPAGYYDASPGAEDLIGWHINQGKDREALFFSASRFRDLYYRPDLTRKALDGSEPAPRPDREALLAAAPPIITILGHRALPNGDVVVDYEATTIFGEPVEIDLFVDNAKVDLKGARSETLAGELQSITVPKGGCAKTAIALIGRTADGRASDAALVNRAALIGAVCDPADAPKPNLYALLIGVSDYANDNLDLNFAHRDAEQFAAFLQEQEGRAFEKVSIKVLSKKETTGKQQIEEALAELELAASDDDVSILFFAGHGVKSERLKDLFFLVRDTELDKLSTTAIDFTRFLTAIRRANGKRFVFLDACFSAFKGEGSLSLFDMNELSNTLGGSDVRVEVFTSSTGDQRSYEHPDWGNGAFTEAILELFRNKLEVAPIPESEVFLEAYRFDGRVTNDELESWIKHRVPVLTQDRQTPTHTGAGSTPYMIAEVD